MIARLRRLVVARPAAVGVLGAVLLLAGGSWYQALVTPPFRFIDEQAHVGYVIEIQKGNLPTIDTPIDAAGGGTALVQRLAIEPGRRQDVWVANNPPLTYILAAGPGALTRALGIPGGPLLGLRLVNVVATAMAIGVVYLLGRDLSGGNRTVGLVAAGLTGATPHLGFIAALAFNDGVSFLASTAVMLALIRVLGAGPGGDPRRAVIHLGIACAFAGATRPMTLLIAMAAGAIAMAWICWRRQTPVLWSAAWLALPTLLSSGWFYVLNMHRYGDPTGSQALFEKFGRVANGSSLSWLTHRAMWDYGFKTITTQRLEAPLPDDPYWRYRLILAITSALMVLAVALVVGISVRNRSGGGGSGRASGSLPTAAWASMLVLAAVPVFASAQHRSGGGAPHPRYLLAMLPVVTIAAAFVLVRLGTRWAGLAAVVGMSVVTFGQTRRSAVWLAENRLGPAGSDLVTAYGNAILRGAGLAAAGIGLVLLCLAIAWPPLHSRS